MKRSSTNQKPKDTESFTNSTETDNKENYPLIERHKIQNTPFWIVGNHEIGYKITWGKYTFNDEPLPTIEATTNWFHDHHWDVTLHMISIAIANADKILEGKNQP